MGHAREGAAQSHEPAGRAAQRRAPQVGTGSSPRKVRNGAEASASTLHRNNSTRDSTLPEIFMDVSNKPRERPLELLTNNSGPQNAHSKTFQKSSLLNTA